MRGARSTLVRMVKTALTYAVGLLLTNFVVFVISQPCSPNLCSGHGSCESSTDGSTSARQCSCNTGWTGADCSLMLCPSGPAWSDGALGIDYAHIEAECSNRGMCDRLKGVCRCDAGFEGQACARKGCPNGCSNHGKCQSMSYYASIQDPGEGTVYKYSDVWDADMIYGCNCDAGYSGPSCDIRNCAVGDDPLTGTEEVCTHVVKRRLIRMIFSP